LSFRSRLILTPWFVSPRTTELRLLRGDTNQDCKQGNTTMAKAFYTLAIMEKNKFIQLIN
jgi:hypothetical protein